MSATAAVASKPVHTPKSLRRQRPNAVPMACCTGLPRGAARGDCVRKRQQDEPVPLLNGASASRPRNEASAITSLTGLNAACPIARRRATESATLHRTSRYFCSNNPNGTALLDGKASQWRARGVRPRKRRCYLRVRGVRGKSRLEMVRKRGNLRLHSVFNTELFQACSTAGPLMVLESRSYDELVHMTALLSAPDAAGCRPIGSIRG